MRKLMMLVAASLTVVSTVLSTAANAGQVLDHVLATKTLTVAVGTDWGKMSFLNDKQELDGSDVAVAKAIADHLGVQVKFVTPGWDIIAGGKWQGRWDMAMGQMTPTAARVKVFDFPAIYFYGPVSAVVHKNSKATKLSDLDGKAFGVGAGTSAESYVNHTFTPNWVAAQPIEFKFTAGKVKSYSSSITALDDLRLGDGVRLDAVVADTPIAQDAIKAGYPLKILPGTLFAAPAAIAILHGDKEFSDEIALAVKGIRDNGKLSELTMKWYGEDFSVEK